MIAAQQHQLEVLQGTKKQRAADLDATKATLASVKLKLGYTKITAPFDGVVGERQVQPGDYVNIGTNLINVVPLDSPGARVFGHIAGWKNVLPFPLSGRAGVLSLNCPGQITPPPPWEVED